MTIDVKKLAPLSIALALTGAAAWYCYSDYYTECGAEAFSEVDAYSQSVYQPTSLTMPEQSLSTLTPVDAKMAEMPDPTVMVPSLPALANQLPGMMVPMPAMGPIGSMGAMPGMPIMPGMPATPSPALLTGEQSLPHVEQSGSMVLPFSPEMPGGLTPATK